MQQFVVPQFIEVEDKIFGPVTTRQFLIILVAAIICFGAFRYGDLALFIFTLAFVGGGALVFAFIKVNGQNFHYFLLNLFQTVRKPSLRIWNNVYTDKELDYLRTSSFAPELAEKEERKQVKREHIRDLALLVNTGGFYKPDEETYYGKQ